MKLFADIASFKTVTCIVSVISQYIFGPLILFGGIGYLFYSFVYRHTVVVIVAVLIAFITSQYLIVKNIHRISACQRKD